MGAESVPELGTSSPSSPSTPICCTFWVTSFSPGLTKGSSSVRTTVTPLEKPLELGLNAFFAAGVMNEVTRLTQPAGSPAAACK